ncbi:N-acetylglucosamine-6-phosphate deacetylase, partial [Glutamicibacter arilaitensis]|jgi:N-acetylglucosamine-6-phosphate deacetylase|uniref:N-acetylglucosamine-6-phosphate deacetylase n=1 Tax=Glutamicibacter arilaitensis TaxID=256701 RepID=A0A2N7S596_9MICC|nr:N-acetylglucosamine-6-phosphate deacetylase [Glutamicibacter arilaitensis]PMQ21304.1 N-acetylglucosamine-6-phosphate deacetylase [Glutamicibacter arilaitensis]HCM93567.1 N-acetylglucosamine-6-phosphate deacetylase [Glutamicibacter sp.]
MTTTRYALYATLISDGLKVTDGVLAVDGDRIRFAGNRDDFNALADADQYPVREVAPGSIIIPGLIDLHCHGALGADFSAPDHSSAAKAIAHLHRSGTTTLLASLVTAEPTAMIEAAELLAELAEAGQIAGIHAEGPFLSEARCGAQDPRYLQAPDPDFVSELVAASRGQLRTMTYAPELAGSEELIEQLVSQGVVPSLGHTNASAQCTADSLRFAREQLRSAGVDGFTERPTVTHLFNGMPPLHHREPGPVAACLEEAVNRNAFVELIADGVHLSPDTVRLVYRLVGAENILLVSDSMAATGLADGQYTLGPQEVNVAMGQARLASDNSLAGGTCTLLEVLQRAVQAGVSPVQAVTSATAIPASLIGLADEVGSLHYGFSADALILDADLQLVQTIRKGEYL